MRRVPAATAVLAALGLAAALLGLTGHAHAQDLQQSERELQAAQREAEARLADLDGAIAGIDTLIAELEPQVRRQPLELELLGDRMARTAESRRTPALVFRQISIDAFMRGDPQLANLLEEVARMRNDQSAMVARELYASVIDGSIADLAAIDAELATLTQQVADLRADYAANTSALADARNRRDAAASERSAIDNRLAEVRRELDRVQRELLRRRYFEQHFLLTGLPGSNPGRPALAVKIDNVEAARPQFGINQADVVFEELVEGGVTRLAAVFHSTGSTPLGPIRSIRTTDVALLANLDRPLFANSGGNAGALAAVRSSSLVDIGQVTEPSVYYREESRRAPHNLFSSTDRLWQTHPSRTTAPPPLFVYRLEGDPLPAAATAAQGVDIAFPNASIAYRWNGSGWARTQNGRAHVDAAGSQVAPANVIVQFTRYGTSAADSRSPEGIVTGRGDALVLTTGHVVRATSSREGPGAPTVYAAGGETIALTPGRTWVALAPPGSATVR